jgi:hypothetical protein
MIWVALERVDFRGDKLIGLSYSLDGAKQATDDWRYARYGLDRYLEWIVTEEQLGHLTFRAQEIGADWAEFNYVIQEWEPTP